MTHKMHSILFLNSLLCHSNILLEGIYVVTVDIMRRNASCFYTMAYLILTTTSKKELLSPSHKRRK